MYYHASQTPGISCLEPRISNHGTPLVYLSSKRENVLVYLSNAVEKYCRQSGFAHSGSWAKWGPYGFTKEGVLLLSEYWPNALEETYKGVGAYIYSVRPQDSIRAFPGIADAYVSDAPVPVCGCEYVPDAYAALLRAASRGEIVIRRYADMTPAGEKWLRETIRKEYENSQEKPDYRHFLLGNFPFLRQICGK